MDCPRMQGIIHYRLGKLQTAKRFLLETVAAGDSRAETLCYCALTHIRLGDRAESQRYCRLARAAAEKVDVEDSQEVQQLLDEFDMLLRSNSDNAEKR